MFFFWAVLSDLALKLAKSGYINKFLKIWYGYHRTKKFESVEKSAKMFTQKVIGEKLSHIVIKVKNFIFSVTFLLIKFFRMSFLAIFPMDSKLASNSAFFDTHIACLNLFTSYYHFLQSLNANADETAQ
jgi:hypothetical protein